MTSLSSRNYRFAIIGNIFEIPEVFRFIIRFVLIHRGAITFPELTAMATGELRQEVHKVEKQREFDEPINIQFTSGTTGLPKGATLTHHGIVNNSLIIGNRIGYHLMEKSINRRPVICSSVPFYHCFGFHFLDFLCLLHLRKCY